MFPGQLGNHIFYLPDDDAILKVGPPKASEAEAMRFVAANTSIPVPKVIDSDFKGERGWIKMSKIPGQLLADAWSSFSDTQKASLAAQLRDYLTQLRNISGDFYGALWREACPDVFFAHLPWTSEANYLLYGPFDTHAAYNLGLIDALRNSRPDGLEPSDSDNALITKIAATTDDRKIFSHGDLHNLNIFVDGKGIITGILDWGTAGFSISGREYFETKDRARSQDWIHVVDDIFPEDAKGDYEILRELNQALVMYTGI
ncbi:kinase-like protein [Sporormia fimetaria CBS 119925]|uniref:Kinase-like protein n=1 Tax=Sporormia fimetaria CBS 119925 TaxID=1340428 RepID=A0A6A6V4E8_9PLEO|nr:kinase-like protein [Sporormia fimetaria CBS 119925]